MDASIIIPTHNRSAYLHDVLQAIARQDADFSAFEVIVVDNNSTDDTKSVVSAFQHAQPEICVRYLFEATPGASIARNHGIGASNGAILCFLDDDSPPRPAWLSALLAVFDDRSVGVAGGPSLLDYRGQFRPPWLEGDLQGLLSGYSLPYTDPTPVVAWEKLPLGCNMAVRREVFDLVGLLRTDLDRQGKDVLAAGDTELVARAIKSGWKVMYVPDAIVMHIVAPERLKKPYIYRIGRGLAASHVRLTSDRRPHIVLRWFASDTLYATRMFGRLIGALLHRKVLWYDDYFVFWMVAQRIPYRLRFLLRES